MTEEQKQDLYNYLFHYNSHKGMWCCFHREDIKHYWNGDAKIIGFGDSPDLAYSDYKHKQLSDE